MPNNVQLGAGYKFQSEQESSRAVYVFRCRYLFEHAAARFSNIFATGLKIPPPKFPFDIVIDPQTKTPKQASANFGLDKHIWEIIFLEHLERV
jgi:hypothetical protein